MTDTALAHMVPTMALATVWAAMARVTALAMAQAMVWAVATDPVTARVMARDTDLATAADMARVTGHMDLVTVDMARATALATAWAVDMAQVMVRLIHAKFFFRTNWIIIDSVICGEYYKLF